MERDKSANHLVLGKVTGAYGIKGWVRIAPFTRLPEDLLAYSNLYIRHLGQITPLIILEANIHKRSILAKIDAIDDRNAAEALRHAEIVIEEGDLASLAEDEFYWKDLENLEVVTVEGVELGVVSHLIETGSNDVMVIKGDRERMIPFMLDHFVKQVDLQGRKIVVDWDPEF